MLPDVDERRMEASIACCCARGVAMVHVDNKETDWRRPRRREYSGAAEMASWAFLIQYRICTPANTARPVPGSNNSELALARSVMLALAMYRRSVKFRPSI